jgi:GT2 family glycosyltransferase
MNAPFLSVVTPVFDTDADALRACLDSVQSQGYRDWEHCLVDDGSSRPHVRELLESARTADIRRRVAYRPANGGIVAASNDGLRMATGEFVAFLDHDDLLTAGILAEVVAALGADPEIDYLYTDEDHLTPAGTTFHPTYKPDWSPERFRSHMYTCHLSVVRRALALEVGGFRSGYEGAQDYDLVLRVTERARRVRHLPTIGYHWRMGPESTAANPDAKPYAHTAGLRAVQDHCDRIGLNGYVRMLAVPGYHRVERVVTGNPSVTAVLATAGASGRVWGAPKTFVLDAVESIVKRAGRYLDAVVVGSSVPLAPGIAESLHAVGGAVVRTLPHAGDLSAAILNRAAAEAGTGYVLLMHDDVEAVSDDFLATMIGLAEDDDVGMVGCRLLAADGTLDHAGHVYMGRPGSAYCGWWPDEIGRSGLLIVDREVSGVSTACALVRRDVFDRVGGFSPAFVGDDRDVDLSLKIRRLGLRILYTPHATLHHFRATDSAPAPSDRAALEGRWYHELRNDPYHHPKLLRGRDDWAVPFGPDA